MSSALVVRVEDRRVREMLDRYEPRELHNTLRRATRAGGAVYRMELKRQARSRSDIPDSFAKTRTKSSSSLRSGLIKTSVRPKSPLVSIFEAGASAHEIAPGKLHWTGYRAMLLSGPAGQRWRSRAFLASMPVMHPGMEARPILAPVFAAATPAAKRATAAVVFGQGTLGLLGLGGDE